MLQKSLSKLIGIKKEQFDNYILTGQIQLQPARLIPALKTGDEMALTSIFLTALKLIKEFRDGFFKEIGLSRSGKAFYYTEASFKDISTSRIDGLIIIISKGKIIDAAFLEMKSGKNNLDKEQLERYITIAKKLKVPKLITVSNEFVADSTHSPVKIKAPKSISLFHFSWTYLITRGQLLLFKNETNIEDKDQIEIMKEVLFYFENPLSGIKGYSQMKPGWKELCENIHAHKSLKLKDSYIEDAVISWHEEEKDMSLLLSRKLGVLVKPASKFKDRIKDDIKAIVKDNAIIGGISVKGAVSDVIIKADFERRVISMSIKIIPPLDKRNSARVTWISKQLMNCTKRSEISFGKINNDLWVESNIKFAQENLKIKLSDLSNLTDLIKDKKDIQAFHISYHKSLGAKFANSKKVIEILEDMILNFYIGVVQYMTNWKRPAPKVVEIKPINEGLNIIAETSPKIGEDSLLMKTENDLNVSKIEDEDFQINDIE